MGTSLHHSRLEGTTPMLARIRKSAEDKDSGFTLIELLVVMIIIGILAAIAIPVFLNQRKKAVDSSIKSDLRTVSLALETIATDGLNFAAAGPNAATAPTLTIGTDVVRLSSGNVVQVTVNPLGTNYCITGWNTKATRSTATNRWVWQSWLGGLQPANITGCQAIPA